MERKGKERKGLVLCALIAAAVFVFAGCPNGNEDETDGGLTDGKYSGKAYGRNSMNSTTNAGDAAYGIPVTVTVTGGKISKVEYTGTYDSDGPGETPSYINRHLDATDTNNTGETFGNSVIANQSFDQYIADASAGATMAMWGLLAAGQEAANKAGFDNWPQVFQGTENVNGVTGNDIVAVNVLINGNKKVQDIYTTTRVSGGLAAILNDKAVTDIVKADGFNKTKLAASITDPDRLDAFVAAGEAALAKAK